MFRTFTDNTVYANSAGAGGGILCDYDSNPIITNTILWGNTAPIGSQIHIALGSIGVAYSDIQGGWEGEGNIDCDPQFCDPENGNFYLDASSCCIGTGESGADIGAYGVGCGQLIPTLSEWGMLIMGLLLLAIGTVAVIRRRRVVTIEGRQ